MLLHFLHVSEVIVNNEGREKGRRKVVDGSLKPTRNRVYSWFAVNAGGNVYFSVGSSREAYLDIDLTFRGQKIGLFVTSRKQKQA